MLTVNRLQKDGAALSRLKPLLAAVFVATSVLFIEPIPKSGHAHSPWQIFFVMFIAIMGLTIQALVLGYPSAFSLNAKRIKSSNDEPRAVGLLSLTRTPLDLGEFVAWFSVVLLAGSTAFGILYVLGFILCYERILIQREKLLALRHGERFQSWANRTPIIFAKRTVWNTPPNSFSWRRVGLEFKLRIFGLLAGLAFVVLRHCIFNGEIPLKELPGVWIVGFASVSIAWAMLAPTQTAIKLWLRIKSIFEPEDRQR